MRRVVLAACVAASSVFAGQAAAAIITATWMGTVQSGTDAGGHFGTSGGDLSGDAFTAVFTFDSDRGILFRDLGGETLAGGPGLTNPVVDIEHATSPGTALLTINGFALAIDGGLESQLATISNPGGGVTLIARAGQAGAPGADIYLLGVDSPLLPLSFHTGFSGADPCTSDSGCLGGLSLLDGTTAELDPTFVSFTVDGAPFFPIGESAVPEPAGWALLIIGFGSLGAMMRRRLSGALRT